MQYLEKSLIIEKSMPSNIASRADTHLNMCAVLSELGRHDVAYEHAKNAIMIVQGNLLMNYLPKRYLNQEPKVLAEITFKDRIAVLAIAYHNLAVE